MQVVAYMSVNARPVTLRSLRRSGVAARIDTTVGTKNRAMRAKNTHTRRSALLNFAT